MGKNSKFFVGLFYGIGDDPPREQGDRCQDAQQNNGFVRAALTFVKNSLGLQNVCALRLGKGAAVLRSVPGYAGSHTVYWYQSNPHTYHVYDTLVNNSGRGYVSFRELDPQNWPNIRCIQALCAGDDSYLEKREVTPAPHKEAPKEPEPLDIEVGGPLSPIPEGSEHTEDSFIVNPFVSPESVREANEAIALYSSDLG